MFSLYAETFNDQNKKCIFNRVSTCKTQISKYICNEHAALFGITYNLSNYQNGNNDSWTSIDMYISAPSNLNIPLFIDTNGEILTSEIHSFAVSACLNYPKINVEELENTIGYLLGLTAFDNRHTFDGWLEDQSTSVIVQDNGVVRSLYPLPPLHRMLFHYAKPSTIVNVDNSQTYLVPNVSLEYDLSNTNVSTYRFVMVNRALTLKYTNKVDCVATPIVLNAIRKNATQPKTLTFKTMMTQTPIVC
jgi:hypothetical protein